MGPSKNMNPIISGIKCQQKCEIPQQCDIPKHAESLPKNIPVKKTVQSQSLEELQSKKQLGRESNKISRGKSNLVATPHRDIKLTNEMKCHNRDDNNRKKGQKLVPVEKKYKI